MKTKLKFIDLYAGLGGFHQALSNLGHKCVWASEYNVNLRKLYVKNLNRISNESYLDSFFKVVKFKMYEKEKLIHREYPFYSYPKRFLYSNQKIIKDFLNPNNQVLFADLLLNDDDAILKFTNTSSLPLKVNYILINDSIVSKPISNNNIINPKIAVFQIGLLCFFV